MADSQETQVAVLTVKMESLTKSLEDHKAETKEANVEQSKAIKEQSAAIQNVDDKLTRYMSRMTIWGGLFMGGIALIELIPRISDTLKMFAK